MELFLTALAIIIFFIGVFSFLIHHYASSLWVRFAGVLVFLIGVPIAWYSLEGMLSEPKHVSIAFAESVKAKETIIISQVLIKDQGMYFWVAIKGEKKPRYFMMDWDERIAKKLQKAKQKARGQKTKVRIKGFLTTLLKDGTKSKEKVKNIIVPVGELKPREESTHKIIKRGFGYSTNDNDAQDNHDSK